MNYKRILKAVNFAAQKHIDQKRKNAAGSPYINHPIEVAEYLARVGDVQDEDILIAAILHDTIEDTKTTYDEVAKEFGKRTADIVAECTDDKSLEKAERKRLQIVNAPHKSDAAKQVKLADKTCNLRALLVDPPGNWDADRQREYFAWATQVIDGLLGVNPALDAAIAAVLADGKKQFGA